MTHLYNNKTLNVNLNYYYLKLQQRNQRLILRLIRKNIRRRAKTHTKTQHRMPHFSATMSKRELRQEFRKLSLRLHPDKGGDEEEFKAMMEEYEKTLKIILKIVEEQASLGG